MTVDIDQLAVLVDAAVEKRLGSSSPARALLRRGPLDERGVCKHGKKWRVDTHIRGYRVRQGGFTSSQAAADWVWKLRNDPDKLNEWLADRLGSTMTVTHTVAFYMHHRGGHVRSAVRYEQMQRHLDRLLGGLVADKLRQHEADGYLRVRLKEGATAKTVFNELSLLRASLRYAWKCDKLTSPPRLTVAKPKSRRKRVAWEEEARRIVANAEPDLYRVIAAAYCLGLRRGEIIEARWSWLHGADLLIPDTKTGEPKAVTLPAGLLEMVEAEPRDPEFLFCRWVKGRNGKRPPKAGRWYKSTLRRAWTQLCERCGVKGLTFHDLRRSMASVAQHRGHSAPAVQNLGGWADAGVMARHYSHTHDRAVQAVSEDLFQAVFVGADSRP